MGLFNMFKKDNKEIESNEVKTSDLEFLLPIAGEVAKLEEVPDEVFSTKMMGDGFSIKPEGTKVFSPISGEVASLFPTKHAIGLKTDDGLEVLIHVGIDTVNLKGEGFTAHVEAGDKVKAGDLLLDVDFNSIKDKVPAIITPIIFTNLNGYEFEVDYGKKDEKDPNVIKVRKG